MKHVSNVIALLFTLFLFLTHVYAEDLSTSTPSCDETLIYEQSTVNSPVSSSSDQLTKTEELTGETEGNSNPEDIEAQTPTNNPDSSENNSLEEESDSNANEASSESGSNKDNSINATDDENNDSPADKNESTDEPKEESQVKPSTTKKSSGISYANARTKAIWDGVSVTVEELGTIWCQIKTDSERKTVLTLELNFDDIDETQLELGYIIAPNTGRAAMRDKPAKAETIIRYCDAGNMAIVLDHSDEYTHILYKGTEGYVLNETIQPVAITEENGQYAQLSKEGRTDGNAMINIRNQPDRGSCKITEWRTGTEVTVWNQLDGWYEIEAEGMRGFVMEEFVTIDPGV